MTEPRFFIDHGMIHDRNTGKHVTTDEDSVFQDGIKCCCDLLNGLSGAAGPDWFPIADAPKDGRDFLAADQRSGAMRVCWRHNPSSRTDDIIVSGTKSTRFGATHYKPIGSPPRPS